MVTQDFWFQLNVTWFVNTVDVTESSSNGEVWSNWVQSFVNLEDGFSRSVQSIFFNVFVVDTIFFTTSDTNFHFQPLVHFSHSLEVFGTSGNVFVIRFFRQIQHMGGEQWSTVFSKEFFISFQHTIEPWQQFLSTVISVQNNWDTVSWSNWSNVVSSSNWTSNGSSLIFVVNTLTGKVSGTTLGSLQDDWGFVVSGSF